MRAGGFPGNPGGLVVSIVKTAGGRAPAHQARGRGRRTWRPTERTAGARMVPPGAGNEARGDGRRGVGVSHSTAEAGELSPRDPVEGGGPRQVAPLEGKTANTPRLGPVSTSRQRIAELARQALGMAVAIAWLPGPRGYATARSEAVCRGAGCGRTRTSGSVGGQGVNGNRKPHICGNRKLHTPGEDVSGGADILPVMPVGRVGLDAGSGATGVLANTRREASDPAVTLRLPHAVRPTLSSASADAPASGSCCPGC